MDDPHQMFCEGKIFVKVTRITWNNKEKEKEK